MIIKLKYGNTNTWLIKGSKGSLLVDTDYAGTLPAFFMSLKGSHTQIPDIGYVLATHYHPDHMGLISELMKMGVKLLLVDVQKECVHFSDSIFARDKLPCMPIDEKSATVISCKESRPFLSSLGISGEIIHTLSHSPDSISLVLDTGECIVGDLEPFEYLDAYDDNAALKCDWDRILTFGPGRILYAHMPEKIIS